KATLEFSRELALNRSLELLARAKGQWAGQNLRSGEKFVLGGPTGVRAYPVGEASGDLGAVASIELRYSTPTSARKALQLSGFVDAGWIQLYHEPPATIPTQTGRNTYPLFGVGIGAVWRATPTLSIEGGWARAIGENPGRGIFGTDVDGGTGAS